MIRGKCKKGRRKQENVNFELSNISVEPAESLCSEYLVFNAGQVRRIDVVEDVLKVMVNWLGCAEESVAGPDDCRKKS